MVPISLSGSWVQARMPLNNSVQVKASGGYLSFARAGWICQPRDSLPACFVLAGLRRLRHPGSRADFNLSLLT